MLAKSKTCAVIGLDGYIVEVDISPGFRPHGLIGASMLKYSPEEVIAVAPVVGVPPIGPGH
jgi:hypothetical protein